MERPNAHGDYDPLVAVDHSAICEDFYLQMKGTTSSYVHAGYERQLQLQRPVFLAFEYVARLMHEVDEERDVLLDDTTQIGVFKSGATFALGLLEYMATTLNIDVDEFYKAWETSSVAVLPLENDDKQTKLQKVKATTKLVEQIGEHHLENLPDEYMELVKKSEDGYEQIQGRVEMFRTGVGYVLGSGYIALQYAYERNKFDDIDFDSLLTQDIEKVIPTHRTLADKFVNMIESGRNNEETSLESIFGKVMQDNVDNNEQMFEVLHALSIALYRNEGEPGMDDVTEAFFTGANLGVHIATDIGDGQLDKSEFIERWLTTRLHHELSKYGPDYHEHTRIDAKKAFEKILNSSSIPHEYAHLIDLIKQEQEYDDENSKAFQDGFQYSLLTLLRQVESQKKSNARKTAQEEIKNFNEEFEAFMHENDLTGGLQEVFEAYIERCKAFNLNPDNLTEDEADTILELTLSDYDRLMPELSEIEIQGPCFLLIIDDENDDLSPALLELGSKISAEISGFRLAVAPADDTYIQLTNETSNIEQIRLRYVPSYVLKNAHITLPDGTEYVETNRIIIGFVVPGTKFHRTDL